MATKNTNTKSKTTVKVILDVRNNKRKKGKASKKASTNKRSKNYKKPYKGQGR